MEDTKFDWSKVICTQNEMAFLHNFKSSLKHKGLMSVCACVSVRVSEGVMGRRQDV